MKALIFRSLENEKKFHLYSLSDLEGLVDQPMYSEQTKKNINKVFCPTILFI